MDHKSLHRAVLVVVLVCKCLPADVHSAPAKSKNEDALVAATDGLCHSQIAMLGESATHGDGRTLAFKVALVQRLVEQCGFTSVFFEASHYEFIHLNRKLRLGQPVSPDDMLSAVGGLWKFNQEFQPLPSFLQHKAQAGQVFLGGLDDQLGQVGQDYGNVEMVTELTNLLPEPQRHVCSTALHKRIYNGDASPYSKAEREQIKTCLSEMHRANAANKIADRQAKAERREMISAAQRWISRDFSSDAEYTVNRDRSMFQDFQWLQKQRPRRDKAIIWAATVHIAKQADPTWGDRTGTNFGSLVFQKYRDRASSLGFSALAGSYKEIGRREIQEVPAAPPDSIEGRAMRGNRSDAIYIGRARLGAMGNAPGAFFRHSYQTLRWSTFLDMVVVFREEHPAGCWRLSPTGRDSSFRFRLSTRRSSYCRMMWRLECFPWTRRERWRNEG